MIKVARARFGSGFFIGVLCSAALVIAAIALPVLQQGPRHAPPLDFQAGSKQASVAPVGAATDKALSPPQDQAGQIDNPPAAPATQVPPAPALADSEIQTVVARWASGEINANPQPHRLSAPKSIKDRVRFWRQIWSKVPGHVHLLVDKRRPWIVHRRVTCRKGSQFQDRACQRQISKALKSTKKKLRKLARRPTRKHRRAYANSRALMKSADKSIIRVAGKKNAIERALIRAQDNLLATEQIFAAVGLPRALSRLALVESLFRSDAVSRSGAVGAFQFTKTTAREYLIVNDDIDERLDPRRSAYAAARYLKALHASLGTWALASTAYNTGPTRMRRLVKKHRTRDLGKIILRARDARFGFDGQNYYAQLVAVTRLTAGLTRDTPPSNKTIRLAKAMQLSELADRLGVSKKTLRLSNPALGSNITSGGELIPVTYLVNVPPKGETLSERKPNAGPRGS